MSKLTEQFKSEFVDYMLAFYSSKSELYADIAMTREEAQFAKNVLESDVSWDFIGDSSDREKGLQIVLNKRDDPDPV